MLPRPLRSLRRLPLCAEAALCLLAVEGLLRLAGLVAIDRVLGATHAMAAGRLRSGAHARRLFLAVATAARRLPGEHRCLAQALTAQPLLGRRGVRASLAIGVRAGAPGAARLPTVVPLAAGGGLFAHAWLQLRGRVIFGGPVREFLRLPPLPLAREARRRPAGGRIAAAMAKAPHRQSRVSCGRAAILRAPVPTAGCEGRQRWSGSNNPAPPIEHGLRR